jgi:phosphate transport system permease protein
MTDRAHLPHGQPPQASRLWRGRTTAQRIREAIIEWFLFACGTLSILVTAAIAFVVLEGSHEFFQDKEWHEQHERQQVRGVAFLMMDPNAGLAGIPWGDVYLHKLNDLPALERDKVSVGYFVTGKEWSATFRRAKYGILPLLAGTVMVALIAAVIALPIGLATAIYLSEYAAPRIRGFVKPTLELLAGIPTVVYGYFAVTTITPFLQMLIPGIEQSNQLAGGIVVGIMIIPTVASLSEDSLRAVPRALRDGSYALGANQFETSVKVVVPAALSGIIASFILGISRAIGETMAVSLACGGLAKFTLDPREGVATMTSFIATIAKGDIEHGSTDFNSLFAVAGMLFFMTLLMNIFAQWILARYRQVYQ